MNFAFIFVVLLAPKAYATKREFTVGKSPT